LGAVTVASLSCVAVWGQTPQGQGQPAQGQAQGQAAQGQPAQESKGPNWKDRAEYDLFESITKATDANKKIELLNQWKQKYPQTDFKKQRQLLYLDAYKTLNQPQQMVNTSKEILAEDPNDFTALYYIALISPTLNQQTPDALDLTEKAGKGMLANMDATFAADKKPAATSDDQWKKARADMEAVAHKALGWAAMIRKNSAVARESFRQSLEKNPAQGEVSYWLGQTIIGEKDVEQYPIGLYHIARAATYDGPGALNDAGRKTVDDYLTKAYTGFHGDAGGLDQLKTQAKTNPLPPAGFDIQSVKEVAEEKLRKEQEFAEQNPKLALWKRIKEALVAPEGEQYFESSMKGAAIPQLRGKVVSHTAKEIKIAIFGEEPEITLELDSPISGKAEPGTEIQFEGVGKAFTKEPFMVTLDVEKAKIEGWPAPEPKKPAGRKPGRSKGR
jgi:tetratricopeptide (TPR) repeat protein